MRRDFVIDKFLQANALTHSFELKDRETQAVKTVTLQQYYKDSYGVTLRFPQLPVVKMTKGAMTVFPIEMCTISAGQRYPFKLDDAQTRAMIQFAVTKPEKRKQDIQRGLDMLDWAKDGVLKHFGVEMSNQMVQTKARLLPPPAVQYRNVEIKPVSTKAAWDLRKSPKFFLPNATPLKSWGICAFDG